ncbi:MAG TPA: FRG domain-containing protein [Nitrospinota bacterium]|nr:FRG domain-containing protein [Nitrospinota bacterium]
MHNWIDYIPEKDREDVRELYKKAKTLESKIALRREWHPKGYLNLSPIKNLEEYFKYIRLCTTESTWFRGEQKDFGSLVPKLYRNIDNDKISEQQKKERKYFFEFQRRARSLVPEISISDTWSWYFLIQHYGGSTRLLDWSQDAAIALFFSLGTEMEDTKNPIVTCLAPTTLLTYALEELGGEDHWSSGTVLYPGEKSTDRWLENITTPNDHSVWGLPASPIALLPPHLNPRITAQRSCFTLFGNKPDGFNKDGKLIVCPCCGRRIFCKLVIDGKRKNDLRKELAKIGITSGKIYPGLDGLCKEITDEIYT